MSDCLFFGCWNEPGHHLWARGGCYVDARKHNLPRPLDGAFAPRRSGDGPIVLGCSHEYPRPPECPQGQFLRHRVGEWSLLQWWDRCQGDKRGACNSTILLRGDHTTEELLAALREHFPHVVENLQRAGVELVDVTPNAPDAAKGEG